MDTMRARNLALTLDEAAAALRAAVVARQTKTRIVVKMARNIEHGEIVEFEGYGDHEVTGWSKSGGQVILACANGHIASFPERQKVRVVREVPIA